VKESKFRNSQEELCLLKFLNEADYPKQVLRIKKSIGFLFGKNEA